MTKFAKVIDLCSGRSEIGKVIKETKCYYTIKVKGYYSNGNSLIERVHKNTMHIDYMHLSFSIIEG